MKESKFGFCVYNPRLVCLESGSRQITHIHITTSLINWSFLYPCVDSYPRLQKSNYWKFSVIRVPAQLQLYQLDLDTGFNELWSFSEERRYFKFLPFVYWQDIIVAPKEKGHLRNFDWFILIWRGKPYTEINVINNKINLNRIPFITIFPN